MRDTAVRDRTALCNQVRSLLGEFGIIINKGIGSIRKALPRILEDGENGLYSIFRESLDLKYAQLTQLDELIDRLKKLITEHGKNHQTVKLLQSIPGYGAIVSSSYFSVVGDGKSFSNGRNVSASVGVVPKQHSTGGKTVLLRISKCGDGYLRKMLINGARSVINHAHKKDDALSLWVTRLVEKQGRNKAAVALANKLARIGWAVITSGKPYQENYGR